MMTCPCGRPTAGWLRLILGLGPRTQLRNNIHAFTFASSKPSFILVSTAERTSLVLGPRFTATFWADFLSRVLGDQYICVNGGPRTATLSACPGACLGDSRRNLGQRRGRPDFGHVGIFINNNQRQKPRGTGFSPQNHAPLAVLGHQGQACGLARES